LQKKLSQAVPIGITKSRRQTARCGSHNYLLVHDSAENTPKGIKTSVSKP